jgi:ubiquinone/menaquinone biosynthesis C-methylase UbiE
MKTGLRTLTHEQARRVYNRIGAGQDSQAFYEDRAVAVLVEHGEFASAHRVFEFGCGTGRFARRLLSDCLPQSATYRGIDLSPTMVALAQRRLEPFGVRTQVVLTDGSPPTNEPDGAYDRFVSNFVLDLLSEDDIAAVFREAHRMLAPGGLLCVASLSTGDGLFSRFMSSFWSRVHALNPALVGGCRPIELSTWLSEASWRIRRQERLAPFGVPSEAVVAERR